jgi:hypothetical protein
MASTAHVLAGLCPNWSAVRIACVAANGGLSRGVSDNLGDSVPNRIRTERRPPRVEAALSFVGAGVPPPTSSWGNMLGGVLAEAFKPPWWMVVFPGAAITITILAVNLFGDALRDFLDPKLRTEARG